ncbi:hypothetical protein R1sor_007475 [Riccia sorocarpa]|uniref:HhH-GPD domain-containing protein n=1 Tax=Riccia sorocarpa TaxID=122646 RepID=A0ABD3HTZ9_9MARC
MDGNIFSSFSFTSPSKLRSRGAGKLNKCDSAAVISSSSSRVSSVKGDSGAQQLKEEKIHYDSKLSSDHEKGSSLNDSWKAKGSSSAVESSLEKVKQCDHLEPANSRKPSHLSDVKGETEDEFSWVKLSAPDLSSGKRKVSPEFSQEGLQESGDIEDSVRGSKKHSLAPPDQERTATLSWWKKGMTTTSTKVAPSDWERILEEVRIMRINRDAPVDLFGSGQLIDRSKDAETQKFHVLIAAMLSTQTRDSITAAAMKRLHAVPGGLTPQRVADDDLTLETLEELLKPVGFYRQKAKYMKAIATMLVKPPYNGSVPGTLSELVKFPGVGLKVGLVVLVVAFGKNDEGIISDSNVRRVCCRLGWVPEGSTPDETRQALEKWLPKDFWAELSFLFVGFGQQICKPVGPKCQICRINSFCPSAFKCGTKKPESTENSQKSQTSRVQVPEVEVHEDTRSSGT